MKLSDVITILQQYRPWPIALADRMKIYPSGRPLGLTVARDNDTLEVCIKSGARDIVRLNEIFGSEQYLIPYADVPTADSSRERVIVDVGANKGFFTLYASQHFEAGVFAYCYEPSPDNLPYLRMNIDRNSIGAEIIPSAVHSSEEAEAVLYEANTPGHHTTLSPDDVRKVADSPPMLTGNQITVPARTFRNELRRIISERGRIDILKIDVEGAELDLLRSVDEDLWERVGYFVAEVWARQQHSRDFEECWTRLDRHFMLHKWSTFFAGNSRYA